ncbi:MAG: hypothetical protein BAJATHORv1_20340 [Candidatus Thorarchaeota archaeon]|nr:MAG: hypothetical protein BAJATHORv1_20340 [Candidatus Thorarchaeota archaeon]
MEIAMDDRALIIQRDNQTSAVAADLHLGFHIELSETKKVTIPSQIENILQRVLKFQEKYQVNTLYLLGDVKHSILVDNEYNWQNIPDFMEKLTDKIEVKIIPGNHDGNLEALLPRNVELVDVRGMKIGHKPSIGLIHGHAWPSEEILESDILIMGHSHPSIKRIKRVISTKAERDILRYGESIPVILKSKIKKNCIRERMGLDSKTDDENGTLIVLPAFNRLISGISINRTDNRLGGPFFENDCVDIKSTQVYSCNEIYLGTLLELQSRFSEMLK